MLIGYRRHLMIATVRNLGVTFNIEIRIQVVVFYGQTRYQLDHGGAPLG